MRRGAYRRRAPRRAKFEFKDGKYQPVLLEEHVVTEIMARLLWAKIKVFRVRERIPGMSKNLSTPGLPDIVGWIPAKVWDEAHYNVLPIPSAVPLYIEAKRPGGVRRPAQIRFINEATQDGCVAFFAESWDDVVREFKTVGITLNYDVGGKP